MMERWHKETVGVRRHEELAAARWLRTVAEKEEAEAVRQRRQKIGRAHV